MKVSATFFISMADCTTQSDAVVLERAFEGERVHHGGEHADVVGGGAVHAAGGGAGTAPEVSAADDDAELESGIDGLADFRAMRSTISGEMLSRALGPRSASPLSLRMARLKGRGSLGRWAWGVVAGG
jgi:hypothetical protein